MWFPVSGLLNTTYGAAPTTSTTYVFSGDTITGTTTGININASADITATDTITALVNQTSPVSVTGANVSGIVAATGGASIDVVNAATVTSAGGVGILANNGATGNGSIDIVDYGNVSGGTAGDPGSGRGNRADRHPCRRRRDRNGSDHEHYVERDPRHFQTGQCERDDLGVDHQFRAVRYLCRKPVDVRFRCKTVCGRRSW